MGIEPPASLELATLHQTSDCMVLSVTWLSLVHPAGTVGVTLFRFAETKRRRASPARTEGGTVTTSRLVFLVADVPARKSRVDTESDTDTERDADALAPSSSVTVTLTG